jgi:hypothetical protein
MTRQETERVGRMILLASAGLVGLALLIQVIHLIFA